MNLVNLRVRAVGYYSFSRYEENRLVKSETFEKIWCNLINNKVCITDLDGKGNNCYTNIEVDNVISKDIDIQKTGSDSCDGYHLRDVLVKVCNEHNIDFCKEEHEINRYKEGLDMYTEFVCYIPKSKKNELNELVCNLINSDQ